MTNFFLKAPQKLSSKVLGTVSKGTPASKNYGKMKIFCDIALILGSRDFVEISHLLELYGAEVSFLAAGIRLFAWTIVSG
jgi:hypothetical protein